MLLKLLNVEQTYFEIGVTCSFNLVINYLESKYSLYKSTGSQPVIYSELGLHMVKTETHSSKP